MDILSRETSTVWAALGSGGIGMRLARSTGHSDHSWFPTRNQISVWFSSFLSALNPRWLCLAGISGIAGSSLSSAALLPALIRHLMRAIPKLMIFSWGNLFSILSQNDEIFHGPVSYPNTGSRTSVWNYTELINWFCHEVEWNYISFQSLLFFSVEQWFIQWL